MSTNSWRECTHQESDYIGRRSRQPKEDREKRAAIAFDDLYFTYLKQRPAVWEIDPERTSFLKETAQLNQELALEMVLARKRSVLSTLVQEWARQGAGYNAEGSSLLWVARSAELTLQGILSAFYNPVTVHSC